MTNNTTYKHNQTPYRRLRAFGRVRIAYNSPLSYKDPTGLAPEKEKGDRVLGLAGDPRAESQVQVIMVNVAEREAALYEWVASLYESNRRIWALFDAQKNGLFAGADNTGNSSQSYRTGKTESNNGTDGNNYAGTDYLGKLKKGTNAEMAKLTKKADKLLKEMQKETNNEVGYLLRLDTKTNELYADYFVGSSNDTWLSFSSNPYGHTLGENEMIIGIVHGHFNLKDFSREDRIVFRELTMGYFSWTNIPKAGSYENYSMSNRFYFKLLHTYNDGPVNGWFGQATLTFNKIDGKNAVSYYKQLNRMGNHVEDLGNKRWYPLFNYINKPYK